MFGFRYTAVFGLSPYAKSYCEPCGKVVSLKCPLALSSFSIFSSVTSTHLCGGHNLELAPEGGYYCFKVLNKFSYAHVSPPHLNVICVMVRQHLLDFLFQKAAKAALGELSIQYWPSQIDKVIQLNSTLQVRHGVMLVGPAGGGKTTTRQILKRALVVLPSIQAREQLEMKGTGDYPEETGSSKTAQSHAV